MQANEGGLLPLGQGASDVFHLLRDQTHTEVFFGGSAGPGKTFNGCLFEITESLRLQGTAGLIFRHTAEDLRKSTLVTFFEAVSKMRLRAGVDYIFKESKREVHWIGGSITYFDYLSYDPGDPNYSRLGGRAYSRAFGDEIDQVEERAIEVLTSRLRYRLKEFCHACAAQHMAVRSEAIDCDDYGNPTLWRCYNCAQVTKGLVPKLLGTGNPGDYWTKYRYVVDAHGDPVKLRPHQARVLVLLDDNPDKAHVAGYRAQLEDLKDDFERQRLLHGDWMIMPKTGREFLHAFRSHEHAREVIAYKPDLALHLSFDFNTAPYMTCLAAQIWMEIQGQWAGRWRVHFLKEFCLRHPYSDTDSMAQHMAAQLHDGAFAGHQAGVFIYGDATGKNNSTMAKADVRHNYDVIHKALRPHLHNASDRVLRRNPPHGMVRDYCNSYLRGDRKVYVTFDPGMTHTVQDMVMVKEAADGGILKQYATDKDTGVRYERYGHCLQAHYYLTTSAFWDDFKEFRRR